MKSEDLLKLLNKEGFKKAKPAKWMEAFGTGYYFYGHPVTGIRVQVYSLGSSLTRLNDSKELSYKYEPVDTLIKLLKGLPITK